MTITPVEVMSDETLAESVTIPAFIAAKETSAIQGLVQRKVVEINAELDVIGESLVITAEHLNYLRRNLKPGSWTSFIHSGLIKCSPKQATDLENAWSKWLRFSEVEPALLATLSARSLNAMANGTPQQRDKIYQALENKEIRNETDVRKFLKKKGAPKKKADTAKDKKEYDATMKMTKKISELQEENKRLRSQNVQLKKMLVQAAIEGVTPAEAKAVKL